MDFTSIIENIITSATVASAVAWSLKKIVDHKLLKDIEIIKSKLNFDSQCELGNVKAKNEYELEARKRLYTELGPLKFQLLLACRDLSGRILRHGTGKQYTISTESYYGKSTIYRLIKPLAFLELVEDKLNITDFSLDEDSLSLLKLRVALHNALCSGSIACDHPNADWTTQAQHIFADNIPVIAKSLVITNDSSVRSICSFDEFDKFLTNGNFSNDPSPLLEILHNFSIATHPIFWVRLVCMGYVCHCYAKKYASTIGLTVEEYNIDVLLSSSSDSYIASNSKKYANIISMVATANSL